MGGSLIDGVRRFLPGLQKPDPGKVVAENMDRAKKRQAYQPTPAEQKALSMLEEPRRVRRMTLDVFEPVWTKCILYTAGVQHVTQIAIGQPWQPRKVEDWVPLPVFNEIQPKVQRIIDFFTRKRPTCYVEPNRRTQTDIDAASVGDAVLQHLWTKNHEDENVDEMATWLTITGNAFKKHFIDISSRSAMRQPRWVEVNEPMIGQDGRPILNDDGTPAMSPRLVEQRDPMTGEIVFDEIPQGDVASEVPSPLAMTVPLASRRLRAGQCPWVMETELYSTELLRAMFPDKANFIPESGQVLTSELYSHRLSSLFSTGLLTGVRQIDPYLMRGFGIVNQLEVAPTVEFPKGLLLIEMDGIPLYIGDLPIDNEFSYEHTGYYRVPGRFWHRGPVEDCLGPQDQLNKMEQALQLNDAFNSNAIWLVPENASIAEGSIRNKPGTVIRYQYPFKPDRIPGESMPPQTVERRRMYSEDIERFSGVRNVIMGDAPAGVTAGVALNRLGEEAEGLFSPVAKRYDRFIERCETAKLKLVQKYYTEPRYISCTGEDGGLIEIADFRGSDLAGNCNVRVEAGSSQPRSKAGMQQMILDAHERGLLPQILMDPAQYDEAMDQLGLTGFYLDKGLDFKRAQWENEMLARTEGYQQVFLRAGDDDLVHLRVHSDFRKTKGFMRLPNAIQNRVLKHEAEHLMHMIQVEAMKEPHQTEQDMKDNGEPGGGEAAAENADQPPGAQDGAPQGGNDAGS